LAVLGVQSGVILIGATGYDSDNVAILRCGGSCAICYGRFASFTTLSTMSACAIEPGSWKSAQIDRALQLFSRDLTQSVPEGRHQRTTNRLSRVKRAR
jgi:hypothetical protein